MFSDPDAPQKVVAIEGLLSPTRTPARRALVVAKPGRDLPEEVTMLASAVDIEVDEHCVGLVLGPMERPVIEKLTARLDRVGAFARWLLNDRSPDNWIHAMMTMDGKYGVWICGSGEADAIFRVVEAEACTQLVEAMYSRDVLGKMIVTLDRITNLAFWVQRASTTTASLRLAAAAFRTVGNEEAAGVCEDLIRNRTAHEGAS